MGILKNIAIGAAGYAVASAKDSKVVGDIIDNNISSKTLEDLIKDYARRHLDIYTCDNKFAHRLHEIAKQYEEYNYDDVYGENF